MIVSAMLNWYDEPPELLRQAVRGAATFADRIVAADGAYSLVGDGSPASPIAQVEAIRSAAFTFGMTVEFLEPQVYEGQVAKRTACLQVAKEGSDWVLPLDADWLIEGDGPAIRTELEEMHANGYEQVAVRFYQPENPELDMDELALNVWHVNEAGLERSTPFIYRSMPEMRYDTNHWSLVCRSEDGREVGLFGATLRPGLARPKTGYLQAEHLFQHLCLFRERKQIERNRDYIAKRDAEVARVGFET